MKIFKYFTSTTSLLMVAFISISLLLTIEVGTRSIVNSNLRMIETQTNQTQNLETSIKQLSQEAEKTRDSKIILLRELQPVLIAQQYGYSQDVGYTIIRESRKYDLRPEFIMALIRMESNWTNVGPNWASATGLMQIETVSGTARSIARDLGYDNYDLQDPVTNIKFGSYYIAKLVRRYGDINTALTAYNMGEGGLQDYMAYYGTSRSGYSRQVLTYQNYYESE